jgi:hypothetical protein
MLPLEGCDGLPLCFWNTDLTPWLLTSDVREQAHAVGERARVHALANRRASELGLSAIVTSMLSGPCMSMMSMEKLLSERLAGQRGRGRACGLWE